MKKRLPVAHRLVYAYSNSGFRGSSYVWKLARILKNETDGDSVFLPNGFPLIINKTDWIARTIYEDTYQRPLIKLLNSISVTECFVDVGANIGITLWNGMKNSAADACYLAVKPSAQCQRNLLLSTRNIRKSGQIHKVALGQEPGRRIMHGLNYPEQSGGASFLSHDGLKGEESEVQTLDELVSNGDISKPVFLLKVDTEGYEEKILGGGKSLISRFETRIFILEVSPGLSSIYWVRKFYDDISSGSTFLY